MKIKIKKLNENAKIPTRGSNSAAGYDLYALEKAEVHGGKTTFIHTGVAVEIPEGYFGAIYARSGLACKQNLRPANCVGIIDSDYRGEIMVALHSDKESIVLKEFLVRHDDGYSAFVPRSEVVHNDDSSYTVEAGERVAQLIIQKFEEIEFEEVDVLEDSSRGEGGFGSTGTK